MSMREALVYEIKLTPHPNADALSLTIIDDSYQCVVKSDDWKDGDLGIFVPPDTIVDTNRPEFSFLASRGEKVKIRACRLRGELSVGLLVKAPQDAKVGDNYYEQLDLVHYEPELNYSTGGSFIKAPDLWSGLSKYDINNARASKIRNMFIDGEDVVVTAKLNGSNCSYCYSDEKMFARSRSGFRGDDDNIFYKPITSEIESFCKSHPEFLLYGESYGHVKSFKYDTNGSPKFRCFDIMRKDRTYLNYNDWLITCKTFDIPTVPIIEITKFNYEKLLEMAENPCPLNNPISEGIVIRPLIERYHPRHGRTIAKIVSNQYLEKSK